MIGNTISHYKILEKLGEGGMGIVYKAQDTKLDRLVALKFLPSHLSASEDDKARFIQEAKAASALNHPNVCTIHDIQHHDGQMFIVMEFVDGQTLRYEAKSRTISLKSAIDIGIQIADALAAGFLCNAHGVRPLGERSRNIGEQRRRARPQIGRVECGCGSKRGVLLPIEGRRVRPNQEAPAVSLIPTSFVGTIVSLRVTSSKLANCCCSASDRRTMRYKRLGMTAEPLQILKLKANFAGRQK
jgi:hypothetical protein